jgi:hypothetical protein
VITGGASGPGGVPGAGHANLGRRQRRLAPDLLDELDQGLAGALQIGAGLVAGELHLLLGDRGVRRDRRVLGAHLLLERRHLGVQIGERSLHLGRVFVTQDACKRALCVRLGGLLAATEHGGAGSFGVINGSRIVLLASIGRTPSAKFLVALRKLDDRACRFAGFFPKVVLRRCRSTVCAAGGRFSRCAPQ